MHVHRTNRSHRGLRSFGIALCLSFSVLAVLVPGMAGATVGEVTKQSTAIMPAPGYMAPNGNASGSPVYIGEPYGGVAKNRAFSLGEALTETELTFKAAPERYINSLVKASDGWLWMSTGSTSLISDPLTTDPGNLIKRKTTEAVWSTFPLPTVAKSCDETKPPFPTPRATCGLSITIGPANTVWYAQYRYGYNAKAEKVEEVQHIGQIKVLEAGQPTVEYNLPTAYASPTGITYDAEGRIWFTESVYLGEGKFSYRVAKAVVNGEGKLEVAEYPLTAGHFTGALVLGADNNMYMFGSVTGGVREAVRIKPTTGEMTLVHTFAEGESTTGVAVGPDGKFWFVDPGAKQMGRMTVAGVVSHYLIPNTSLCTPQQMAKGWSNSMIMSESCPTAASKGRFSVVATK